VKASDLLLPVVRAWIRSLRLRLPEDPPRGACVYACWHADLVAAAAYFREVPATALVSGSRDGDLLVAALSGRKLSFARGSSRRGGSTGARACLRTLRSGRAVATTWDGPRGPAGVRKPGPAWMSTRSRAPLVEVRFRYGARFRLGDWSRLAVPLPFSRVEVSFGPAEVPA
jgi:lysophospholipid acyltransferase (LPLAT)-like uncharacterized protein